MIIMDDIMEEKKPEEKNNGRIGMNIWKRGHVRKGKKGKNIEMKNDANIKRSAAW
jgi:hypothetical protein